MAIYVIMPKHLKIIRLEVNRNSTIIMLKKWAGFHAEGGKNEDAWHHFLRHDKCVRGTCISKLG